MTLPAPTVQPLGEAGWTVVLGDRVDAAVHARVLDLAARIRSAGLPGLQEIVPAYAALTVFFDPRRADAEAIRDWLLRGHPEQSEGIGARPDPLPSAAPRPQDDSTVVTIPVRYDGPDLDEVAARTGRTRDDVVRLHTEREYRVYLLGFAPGFAYLGDLAPALVLPRRATPRTRVPPGSVAIAGAQTAVYPLGTPGGWHLLGRTELRLFDPAREPPVLLQPGNRVRFEAFG